VVFILFPLRAYAALTNDLYTGDTTTVGAGKYQLKSYFDLSFTGSQRIAGGSLTYGPTQNVDTRLGYGYLWNDVGQNARLGPNIGVKWRFIGDGLRKPSAAISSLFAINEGVGGKPHKNDWGALFIVQYPIKPVILLANFGHVLVGDDNASDLRYVSFAAAHFLSKRSLTALEYSQLSRLTGPTSGYRSQIAAAYVYAPNQSINYSAQLGYLWPESDTKLHLTLGISVYL
jgi:hypothetical protein